MHLQIRKKEKYLLFSMIGYLIIISLVLFLMVSPVNAWTEINSYTIANSGTNLYTLQKFNFNTLQSFQDNVTWVHWEGTAEAFGSYAASGSMSVDLIDANDNSDCGDGTFEWSTSKVGPVASTFDLYITSFTAAGCGNPVKLKNAGNDILSTANLYFATYKGGGSGVPSFNAIDNILESSMPRYGTWTIYGGTSAPPAPVINEVTSFPSCLESGTGVVLESNVTGTVDDWTWEIYEPDNPVAVFTSLTPIETMVDPYILEPGYYDVQLTVENGGGTDFWQQDDFLYINQSGTCNFTPYNPFPTISTTPTQNVFVTMTMPPAVLVNMTGVNDVVNNSYLGNWSLAYRQDVDRIGEGFNTTLVGVVSIVQSPLTMIVNGIAEGVSLFSVSVNSLMSYTTIPLAIVGITLSYYPWQIITLITAGIAIDAAFILIFGVR